MNTNSRQQNNQPNAVNTNQTARRIKAQRAAPGDQMVYCVDLAKEHFHVNRYSAGGELLSSKAMRRAHFEKLVRDPQRPRGMWVMEACGGAHFWGRTLLALKDQVKLVPPQFVAKQRVGNKNDSNDAQAIFAVHLDARVHPVPVKTAAQQGDLVIHTVRQHCIKNRTSTSNCLRSILAEQGFVTNKGAASLQALVTELSDVSQASQLERGIQIVLVNLHTLLDTIEQQVEALDQAIRQQVAASAPAQRLMEAPGIGPITASAVVAEYRGNVARFTDARQFAATIGITPGEHSSGGKTRLGGITKRGNEYLRRLLVQGAQTLVNSACPKLNSKRAIAQQAEPETAKSDDLHVFARKLRARKPRHVVVIAVANRMARMVYAMLKSGLNYRAQRIKRSNHEKQTTALKVKTTAKTTTTTTITKTAIPA
jgi:transposase